MTAVRTTCPYCGVGCGILATANGTIKGDPDHPANFGRLCSKGSALGETIDLDGRLLAPQIAGRQADWDKALDLVAGKFSAAIREHGPDSVAFYVSGQLLTEDYYVANKLMKGYIGSANIDTNSRLCMASSVAGHKRAFGTDTVPGTYEDLERADLIVLVGSNLAWCHPVLYQRIVAAKSARPSLKIVNIDPRRTATSGIADLHLSIAPDGDTALFNGLLAYLTRTGAVDHTYVQKHVSGFDEAVQNAQQTALDECGIDPVQLQAFYHLWAGTKKTVTIYSQGVNQSVGGSDKVNAIINCHLATGRIGKPGMGPLSVTGQPNAMGGREVGGLANMLAAHLDLDDPDHRAAVQHFWNSPTICTTPGHKAVDLFQACADGRIKALWVMSTNPAVSMPNANQVAAAINNVPFTVVSDIMTRTDTGDLADVLLPATGWGEKSGAVTNSERRISRQRAFLPAPANTRPDWKIICDIAARMGWSDAFSYRSPAEIFREYAAMTELSQQFGKALDLTGLSDLSEGAYDSLAPVQWPVPKTGASGGRFFSDGSFFHADARARMIAVNAPAKQAHGFVLNTGRIRDQWHTMTRTGKTARLSGHLAEPFVEINPADAAGLGIAQATLVEVSSAGQTVVLRALITDRVVAGHLFSPMHWTRQFTSSGVINTVVGAVVDPVSGQPGLKAVQVNARAHPTVWYGYLAAVAEPTQHGCYFARARTKTGWQAEMAGSTTPDDWHAVLRDMTDCQTGEICQLDDVASGLIRLALTWENRILAVLFISAQPVALSRQVAIDFVGTQMNPLQALSGRMRADQIDDGAIICSCFSVGVNSVRRAIGEGAGTVDAIGASTCAGTNCGSCKPELSAMIAAFKLPMAAE